MSERSTGDRIGQRIEDIRYYTGGDQCLYDCEDVAEFVVQANSGEKTLTFYACQSCLNEQAIWPYDNGWVDGRDVTEKRRNA